MRVKDYLAHNRINKLEGLKIRTPKLVVGYIFSVSNTVVYLSPVNGQSNPNGRLFPQVINKREDIYNWEVVNPDTPCNCDVLVQHKYIMLV